MNAVAETAATTSREIAVARGRLASWMSRGLALLRNLGPYAAIEIFLPGGTLMALLLWLYRRHRKQQARSSSLGISGSIEAEATIYPLRS